MENTLFYKDYFSLKTLHRFGVNPDLGLNLKASKAEILSPFGKLSVSDKTYLENKVDVALRDNGLQKEIEQTVGKQMLMIDELDERIYDFEENTLDTREESISIESPKIEDEEIKI